MLPPDAKQLSINSFVCEEESKTQYDEDSASVSQDEKLPKSGILKHAL